MSTFFSPSRECQLLSRRQGPHSTPMLLPKMPAPNGAVWSGRRLGGACWVCLGVCGVRGRARQGSARVCLFWGGSSGIQTPGTGGRMRGIRSCSRLPWLHISEKQAKGKKKKEVEENQNILLGGKKNSGVKKCRRVMRRPSEAKKCMRSSLETGV